ncbi:TetR/AcrR family transcriptional regulator [Paenibacillus sp. TAB 01]|uniref:TetR/AcrR family transcriptional regulator n=1 Tax=Paenibacillus sp. TAB 01 TaxID=3368988 RepID=UPI003751FCE3
MDEAIRSRIVQAASELFNAKGYRSITLSELAVRLGMSKKTLYLYFDGKEQIAEAVLNRTLEAIAGRVAAVKERPAEDPFELFHTAFSGIKQEIMKLNPLFLEDVQRFIPELWAKVEAFRGRQLAFLEKLLEEAQRRGQIRDIDTRLVSTLLMQSIQTFVRPDFAAKHGFVLADVADTLFTLFIEGLRADNKK